MIHFKRTYSYVLFLFSYMCAGSLWGAETQQVSFHVKDREHKYMLEVARTAQEKQKGLMFRKTLALDAGMLFIYDKPQKVGIWMKNTFIPLDIIFISCDQTIDKIFENLKPLSQQVVYPDRKICFIIELVAGQVKKMGINNDNNVVITGLTQ